MQIFFCDRFMVLVYKINYILVNLIALSDFKIPVQ